MSCAKHRCVSCCSPQRHFSPPQTRACANESEAEVSATTGRALRRRNTLHTAITDQGCICCQCCISRVSCPSQRGRLVEQGVHHTHTFHPLTNSVTGRLEALRLASPISVLIREKKQRLEGVTRVPRSRSVSILLSEIDRSR